MRLTCFLFTVIATAITFASPLSADDYLQFRSHWQWQFVSATPDHQNAGASQAFLGVGPLATDGWDGESILGTAYSPTAFVASFHTEDPDTWSGPTGFYAEDIRAPLVPSETKKWIVYVWATLDVPDTSDTIELVMRNPWMAFPPEEYGLQFCLTLKWKPGSITGGPDVGATWDFHDSTFGFLLPTYRTDNGLSGYQFEFSATAAPEPSSLLALGGGLAAVGIPFIRRRRR